MKQMAARNFLRIKHHTAQAPISVKTLAIAATGCTPSRLKVAIASDLRVTSIAIIASRPFCDAHLGRDRPALDVLDVPSHRLRALGFAAIPLLAG